MLTKYTPPRHVKKTLYSLTFDDGAGTGLDFPCDENGNLADLTELAKKSLEDCLKHPERFKQWNQVVETEIQVREDPVGVCECGREFILSDSYLGACQCPGCGQWYNLFGQELLPPGKWDEVF